MSFFGKLKGTDFEDFAKQSMQGELMGVKMYLAMALYAKEQGYDDAAELFHHIAVQEGEHAGFYAALLGEVPEDFWDVAKKIQALEEQADEKLGSMADSLRQAGFADVADHVKFIASQEDQHGIKLKALFEKHGK